MSEMEELIKEMSRKLEEKDKIIAEAKGGQALQNKSADTSHSNIVDTVKTLK